MKSATASLRYCGHLSEQNMSQALYFANSFFRIEQLATLFSAHNVLY